MDPLLLIPAAFLAGIVMFLAPCTLPLVPGYLAFISAGKGTLKNAIAFVIGFSLVFILLGTFAGIIGMALGPWRLILARGAGALLIVFGLMMLGVLKIPMLSGEYRARIPKFLTLGRPESSFLVGALFALGWSPCIGPILGTILLVASTSNTILQGAILLAAFSLGMGVPFLLTAILIERAQKSFSEWSKFTNALSIVGGCVLIFLGVLMLTDRIGLLVTWGAALFTPGFNFLAQFM